MSRVFAIGDIHGCFTALQTLLQVVPLTSQDLIVTLGDHIDRGPESRQVVDWLIEQTRLERCVPLRGNHEIMMLDALRGRMPVQEWMHYGGRNMLASYSSNGQPIRLDEVPVDHLRFLDRELLPFYETETHLFVHASVDPTLPMAEQSPVTLYWERFDKIAPHQSGKTVVCGHTSQHSGLPDDRGFAVCIDTWACGSGWLTCLDVATGQYWQANQQGKTRTLWLASPAT